MNIRTLCVLCAIAAPVTQGTLLSASAIGIPLQPPSTAISAYLGPYVGSNGTYPVTSSSSFGTVSSIDAFGRVYSSSTAGIDPEADIVAYSLESTNRSYFAEASAEVEYQFQVVGPSGPSVPVQVNSNLNASTTALGNTGAFAQLYVHQGATSSLYEYVCSGTLYPSCSSDNATINETLFLTPNSVYDVLLLTQIGVSPSGFAELWTADSFVDPTFTLPISERDRYSIQYSPNLLETPEPSALILLASGVIWFALAARWRSSRRGNLV